MQIYKVGGAVRDRLLNLPVKDNDWVVVGATIEVMEEQGYQQVGRDFPVFLHPKTHEEYALARTERKTAAGYQGFVVHATPNVSLEDDLLRRDLTINAMAEAEDGSIIDLFNGQADLQAGILRHVSPAFIEDPVRILRLARFAARFNFHVADETQQLMQHMVENGEVDALVAERVWAELDRALIEPYPQRFIEVLRQCGALAKILPEIDQLFGVPQPEQYHPEVDTGIHMLLSLQRARALTEDAETLFAVLCHDIGKGTTDPALHPKHIKHEIRGIDSVRALCNRWRVPKSFKEMALLVTEYHTHCHRAESLQPKTWVKLFQAINPVRFPQRVTQFLIACQADAQGRTGYEDTPYPQAKLCRQVFAVIATVEVKAIIEAGFTGAAISEELHVQRVKAVRGYLKSLNLR